MEEVKIETNEKQIRKIKSEHSKKFVPVTKWNKTHFLFRKVFLFLFKETKIFSSQTKIKQTY